MSADWVDTATVALALGCSPRAVQKAFQRAFDARLAWHGVLIKVRRVPGGRGGRGGQVFEGYVPSLPENIRAALTQRAPAPLALTDKSRSDVQERFAAIEPILNAETRAARAQAVAQAARVLSLSQQRVYELVNAYRAQGLGGLAGKAGRGRKEALISTAWDRATRHCDEAARQAVIQKLISYVKGCAANGDAISSIGFAAGLRLIEWTQNALGVHGKWSVPRGFIEKHSKPVKILAVKRRDAKQFFDKHLPRIERTTAGLRPMDVLFGDVHHLDFLLRKPDGYKAYASMVCWYDVATGRVWADVFQLPEGQSIRNEHVIQSFIRMAGDPAWGVPATLYVDNGSEYNWTDFIADLLKLASYHSLRVECGKRNSRPYNAPAKPIEGVFSVLNRTIFPSLPGFIGGNRMASKVANVGKAPLEFPGDFARLESTTQAAVTIYHHTPQGKRSRLKGRSPYATHASFSDFQSVTLDPDALATVFAIEETREVRKGRIDVKGRAYYGDVLTHLTGQKIVVLIPKYERDWERLPIKYNGRIVGYVEPDLAYDHLDGEGAREQSRRASVQNKHLRALSSAHPQIDAIANIRETNALAVKHLGGPPVIVSGGHITASDEQAEIRRNVRMKPAEAKRLQRDVDQANLAEQADLIAEFNRKIAGKR